MKKKIRVYFFFIIFKWKMVSWNFRFEVCLLSRSCSIVLCSVILEKDVRLFLLSWAFDPDSCISDFIILEKLANENPHFRYYSCWLPLLAKHSECPFFEGPLVVPLDCEWIWHCHRLNPVGFWTIETFVYIFTFLTWCFLWHFCLCRLDTKLIARNYMGGFLTTITLCLPWK